MTSAPPIAPPESPTPPAGARAAPNSHHAAWFACVFALGMGLLISTLCYFAAGPTLGLFLGTTVLLCIIAPTLLTPFRWPTLAGLWLGVALVWLFATTQPSIYLMDVFRSLIVIAALLLALAGQVQLVRYLRLPAVLASALITVLALASLTWPIWAVDALEGPHAEALVALLIPLSPAMAINGTMPHLGAWDHFPHLAYTTLTVLNQDVAYRLPPSILPATLLHAAMGLLLMLRAMPVSTTPRPALKTRVRTRR